MVLNNTIHFFLGSHQTKSDSEAAIFEIKKVIKKYPDSSKILVLEFGGVGVNGAADIDENLYLTNLKLSNNRSEFEKLFSERLKERSAILKAYNEDNQVQPNLADFCAPFLILQKIIILQ